MKCRDCGRFISEENAEGREPELGGFRCREGTGCWPTREILCGVCGKAMHPDGIPESEIVEAKRNGFDYSQSTCPTPWRYS